MSSSIATTFLPVAPPQIFEGAWSDDQYGRMLKVIRDNGPWTVLLSQYFKSPEEVIATTSGILPEGFTPTWDMFLSPIFRGFFAEGGVALYPEVEDCFLNTDFLNRVRAYWGAKYAQPDQLFFNLQGPTPAGGPPHVDGTHFRGMYAKDAPIWLLNIMAKSGLFRRWQAKKAQVITWFYKGRIGGGFQYWPDGLQSEPKLLAAPIWNRAVVVENERMYHTSQACGPVKMRKPEGLAINSTIAPDPQTEAGWQITTDTKIIQRIPENEFRLLIHWGAQIFMDYDELKKTLDHSDDITHEKAFDIFVQDLRARGELFEMPTDPLSDVNFIKLLTRVYDLGLPRIMLPDPVDEVAVGFN